MNYQKILNIINTIREHKGLSKIESISDSNDLRNDFNFDSFDLAELTVRIEDEFNIDVFEDGVVNKISEIMSQLKSNQ